MHRIRPFLTIPLGLVVIILAVANRHDVVIELSPLPWSLDVPLYALILATFALGTITGGLATWTGRVRKQRRQKKKPQKAPQAPQAKTPENRQSSSPTALPRS